MIEILVGMIMLATIGYVVIGFLSTLGEAP